MSEPDVEDFLAHYGVKGMKWGVRKAENRVKRSRSPEERKALAKKVILGSLAVSAAVAVGAAGSKSVATSRAIQRRTDARKFADQAIKRAMDNGARNVRLRGDGVLVTEMFDGRIVSSVYGWSKDLV